MMFGTIELADERAVHKRRVLKATMRARTSIQVTRATNAAKPGGSPHLSSG
jgi:hypothetical protein